MDTKTGDIYSPEDMKHMSKAFRDLMGHDPKQEARPKELVEITPEQYEEMEGMTKEDRIKYLGKKRCPCGSRKRRSACCGVYA